MVLHRIFFTIWVNYPFNVFLYPAWNGIFITDNMWCALDQNGAVGLCHFFFFDAARPDKTRHSQLKPLVCCHTYSQSLFMECDHQLQRLWERESGHNLGIETVEQKKSRLQCDQSKIKIPGWDLSLNSIDTQHVW